MKLLLVHYLLPRKREPDRYIKNIVQMIEEIFESTVLTEKPKIIVRDKSNLDDYLYDTESEKYDLLNNRERFDLIDFVVLIGDAGLMPWERRCAKLSLLFNMSKITNKMMFVGGFGMQFLACFCAYGMKKLQVINGNEKGGPLSEL